MQKRLFKESIPLYEQALPLAEKEFGKESENYLKTRNGMGRSITFVGEKKQTEKFLYETVRLAEKFDANSEGYATVLHNLGTFSYPWGENLVNAERYLTEALLLRKKLFGEFNTDYSATLNNLVLAYWTMQDYTFAEKLCRQNLAIQKKLSTSA